MRIYPPFIFFILLLAGPVSAQSFISITDTPPVTDAGGSRSVNWVDVDGDNDLDLFVSNGGSLGEDNALYLNEGGQFSKVTNSPIVQDGLRADGSTWGDMDNDGDPDMCVVSWYNELNALYVNEGGSFQAVSEGDVVTEATFSETVTWVDYDQDSDLDLYVVNSGNNAAEDNILYQNNGDGTLTELSDHPLSNDNRYSRTAAWCDYDNDGDPDVYIANESGAANLLFRNLLSETGAADFEQITDGPAVTQLGTTFSASWGDMDNDGDFDLFVANSNNQTNILYKNMLSETGTADLEPINNSFVALEPSWSVSSSWGDMDNDGDLDLYVTNGWHPNSTVEHTNLLYENDGQGNFTPVTTGPLVEESGWSYGASWGDYDNDGDLDMFVAQWLENDEENALYQNQADQTGHHWLRIELDGQTSNRSGIGAVIRVKAMIGGQTVWQQRQVSGQDSYCGQNLWQFFGLGGASLVDSLVVHWPSGIVQTLTNVAVDQHLTITEDTANAIEGTVDEVNGTTDFGLINYPNPFRSQTHFAFQLPTAGHVTLEIYNAAGQFVTSVQGGPLSVGSHVLSWNASNDGDKDIGPGLYFYRLSAPGVANNSKINRMVVLR